MCSCTQRVALIENNIGMKRPIVDSFTGITLVGGGPVTVAALRAAQAIAPVVVAADGGADACHRAGLVPAAVIGDMDSISDTVRAALDADRLHHIGEQATTDFDKALRSIAAPFVLALGFTGARVDHQLAVFNTLVRMPHQACIVVGTQDVVFHAPAALRLKMRVGDRFSLFPMAGVTGHSEGLEWPIDGISFAPDAMIGTSNRVSASLVRVEMDGSGMLVIVPRKCLAAVISALVRPA